MSEDTAEDIKIIIDACINEEDMMKLISTGNGISFVSKVEDRCYVRHYSRGETSERKYIDRDVTLVPGTNHFICRTDGTNPRKSCQIQRNAILDSKVKFKEEDKHLNQFYLLDIESMFFIFCERIKFLGIGNAINIARKRTLEFLQNVINQFETVPHMLELYLSSCAFQLGVLRLTEIKEIDYKGDPVEGTTKIEFLVNLLKISIERVI